MNAKWYSITPAGAVAIGNLTPVGQNSGQVGCRWPPNGHQLAGCLNLPMFAQLWGPFWHSIDNPTAIYVSLPQTIYYLTEGGDQSNQQAFPRTFYRCIWLDNQWQVISQHQRMGKKLQLCGGQYLITGEALQSLWRNGQLTININQSKDLVALPWETLTLSHNSRENYRVKDEAGFFAEMTTMMPSGWSILVRIMGDYTPPTSSYLGAGATPVIITEVDVDDEWLLKSCPNPTGAILLTGGLWQKTDEKVSLPYPNLPIRAYAASEGIPWQSWTNIQGKVKKRQVLTPGEWLTPAGAVYLWEGQSSLCESQPYRDSYHRDALGYGHLWLFSEKEQE